MQNVFLISFYRGFSYESFISCYAVCSTYYIVLNGENPKVKYLLEKLSGTPSTRISVTLPSTLCFQLLSNCMHLCTVFCPRHSLQMLTQFCLFIMWNAYVPEGGNEGEREASLTSISIFDFYAIKTLWFEFGNDIFTGNKMPTL